MPADARSRAIVFAPGSNFGRGLSALSLAAVAIVESRLLPAAEPDVAPACLDSQPARHIGSIATTSAAIDSMRPADWLLSIVIRRSMSSLPGVIGLERKHGILGSAGEVARFDVEDAADAKNSL